MPHLSAYLNWGVATSSAEAASEAAFACSTSTDSSSAAMKIEDLIGSSWDSCGEKEQFVS